MSEVDATGMLNCVPGCAEGVCYSPHTFVGACSILAWTDTPFVLQQGFLRTSEADGWMWKPTFLLCNQKYFNVKNALLGF